MIMENSMHMQNDYKIDFVVTWVDGADTTWQNKKKQYDASANATDSLLDADNNRYRDYDVFKYWFRGVEKFCPWVNRVFLITDNQIPDFLNINSHKLVVIDHKDYIPSEYLPLFNSNAIEMLLNQIPGLSEHFVYFNDDMFLIRPTKTDVFFKNGLPCDCLAFQPVIANKSNPVMSHIFINNSIALARHFNKLENVKKQPQAYFHIGYPLRNFIYNIIELAFPQITGFFNSHSPAPLLKNTLEECWANEKSALTNTLSHRFRSSDDMSIYFFRDWQKLTGKFKPRNIVKTCAYGELGRDTKKILHIISHQKTNMICINDTDQTDDFDYTKQTLVDAFESILPEKSSFEK